MKALLMLISLTAGTAAVIHTVDLLNTATVTLDQALMEARR